jgi:putative DNA primase/helicase
VLVQDGSSNGAIESIQSQHDVALAAVLRGWRPLPITADGRKIPLVKFTGENGVNLAASSPADVHTLWVEDFPRAGVAVVTGSTSYEGSGLLVIDVDVKDGAQGPASIQAALVELGPLPPTMVVTSPSGGWHYVYAYPDDSDTWRNWNGWRPGVDVRGHHGIVAVPGSTDVRGEYVLSPVGTAEIAQLPPAWLEALVRPAADLDAREAFRDRELATDSPELRRQKVIAREELEILCTALAEPGPGKHGRLIRYATMAGSWSHLIGDDTYVEARLLDALERAHTARGGHIDRARSTKHVQTLVRNGQVNPKWAPPTSGGTLLGNLADYALPSLVAPEDRPVPARNWDDMGNGERLVDHRGEGLAFALDAGQWLVYSDAGAWGTTGGETLAQRRAQETLEIAYDAEQGHYSTLPSTNAAGKDTPSDRELFFAFLGKSRSARGVAAMVKMASSHPAMETTLGSFDAEPLLLNVANGVVDLTTGELLPHAASYRMTQLAPVRWQIGGEAAPLWEKFLAQVQPDPEVRAYLQRAIGYTLTGLTTEQKMFIHHGSGANGKSVFMDTLARVLGSYAQAIPRSTLLAKAGDAGVPNDIARMRGKRLLRTSETAAGRRLDGELVKELTGGEMVSARHMRAEFFDFQPTGKVHLTTNHVPQLGADDAIRRRLETISWGVVVPVADRDPDLTQKLGLEATGILSWAVRGCLEWRRIGLATPAAVVAKTDEHLAMADALGDWIASRLDRVPGAQVEITRLYADYRAWAEAHGERPMIARSLSEALTERGFIRGGRIGRNHVRVFDDVTLRPTALEEAAGGSGVGHAGLSIVSPL